MTDGVASRAEAATLVGRVIDDGAHSNVLLAGVLGDEQHTVHRLVLDTLRYLPPARATLAGLSNRPLEDLDPVVRNALLVGITELMTGGDAHGVVNSTVEVVKRSDARRAAGFVNAVLRKAAGGFRPQVAGEAEAAALSVAAPTWIRERLVDQWGATEAGDFFRSTLTVPRIGVRIRPGCASIGEAVPGIAGAAHVADRAAVASAGSGVVVMDASSTAVALAVGAERGERVLDVAAAPGNKTAALWDAMGGEGLLVAADRHRRRVRSAAHRLRKLGVDVPWVVADGLAPPFAPASFDRILLDAPCTGLGTVRRRPEIKSQLDPDAPQRMSELQSRLVAAALRLLRPGGRLVYSVCTVFAEETTAIAAEFGGRPPKGLPGRRYGGGLLMGPHLTDTDGMFITVLE